jgi:hypothetical protein
MKLPNVKHLYKAHPGYFLLGGLGLAGGIVYINHNKTKSNLQQSSVIAQAYATAAAGGVGQGAGCSPDANPGGNSPGWYTEGANSSGGAGWTGKAGHHHCDWKKQCCFCTDVPKCIRTGTPPQQPGSCRPDWGTTGYLGGGQYPKAADFSKCPAGTAPGGGGGGASTAPVDTSTAPVDTSTTPAASSSLPSFDFSSITNFLQAHTKAIVIVVGAIILLPMLKKI